MNTNILTYRVIIQKDGKGYHAFVPSLVGCHSFGKTVEEAKSNIREAIVGYIKVAQAKDYPIIDENSLESFESFDLKKISSDNSMINYA